MLLASGVTFSLGCTLVRIATATHQRPSQPWLPGGPAWRLPDDLAVDFAVLGKLRMQFRLD